MIQANHVDFYYIKLHKAIKTSLLIESIIIHHFSDLSIDTNDYICQFNRLWVLNNLQVILIRDVHDQIAIRYLDYQKTISFITYNYY